MMSVFEAVEFWLNNSLVLFHYRFELQNSAKKLRTELSSSSHHNHISAPTTQGKEIVQSLRYLGRGRYLYLETDTST